MPCTHKVSLRNICVDVPDFSDIESDIETGYTEFLADGETKYVALSDQRDETVKNERGIRHYISTVQEMYKQLVLDKRRDSHIKGNGRNKRYQGTKSYRYCRSWYDNKRGLLFLRLQLYI